MRATIVYVLAAIPVVDAVIDQAQTVLLLPSIGGLSFLQVMRGTILLCAVIYLLPKNSLLSSRLRMPLLVTLCYATSLGLVSFKEVVITGSLAMGSIVAYFQILYWLILWLVVQLGCKTPKDAKFILMGLLIGAIIASISIWYAYFAELGQYYTWQGETLSSDTWMGVTSSSGGFLTGKFVCGNLLTGALIAVYFGWFKHRWLYAIGSILCAASVFITYARAGQVALALVIIWFVIWLLKWWKQISGKDWLIRLGMLLCVVAVVGISVLEVSDLVHRWADISDLERAGSGRATVWLISVRAFCDDSLLDQAIGLGYSSMQDMLDARYGLRIHTHNDFLDMLLTGGLFGAFSLMLVWILMVGFLKRIRAVTLERAFATSVVIVYFVQGMFTGQIFGMSPMLAYVFSLTCFAVIGEEKRSTGTISWL